MICPCISPSGKVLRLLASIQNVIRWCFSLGFLAPCPLGKFCQDLKFVYLDLKLENPRTLNINEIVSATSAHLEHCYSFVWFFRALLEVRNLLIGKHSRTLESSAISCPTHLVDLSPSCVCYLSWPVRNSVTSNSC